MSKNEINGIKDIKELLDQADLLAEAVRFKIADVKKSLESPAYLKSLIISREKELFDKMNDILKGLNELKRVQSRD